MSSIAGDKKGSMSEMVDSVSGGLMNIILGALILWVGQTTFEHAGQLASVDKRFEGIGHQFETVEHKFSTVEKVYGEFRDRLQQEFDDIDQKTVSRFTREDGDKLELRLRKVSERVVALQLQLAALESQQADGVEIAALRAEVVQLRTALSLTPQQRVASGGPVYLPPVNLQR